MRNRSRAHRATAIATAATVVAGFGVLIAQPAFSAGPRAGVAGDPAPTPVLTKPALTRAVITGVSPATGPVEGGTAVILVGQDFSTVDTSYAGSVMFGDVPATRFVVSSDTRIIAFAPPGTAGDVAVKVINILGASKGSATFGYRAKLAGEIEDATAGASGGSKILATVTEGSIGTTTAEFNALKVTAKVGELAATASWKDAEHVLITVPKSSTTGAVPIRLVQKGYAGPASTGTVTYYPEITKIAPSLVDLEGGTEVTITGAGFLGVDPDDASAVTFGDVPAPHFEVVSATQIVATAPAGAAGQARVKIASAGGDSPEAVAAKVGYRGPLSIETTGQFVRAGGGAHVLTVTGGTLGAGAAEFAAEQLKVRVGATKSLLTPTWVDATRLRVTLPSRMSGSMELRIVQGAIEGPVAELDVVPVITAMSVTSDALAGGKSVKITAAGAGVATGFMFGDTAATCAISGATSFLCTVPPADQVGPVIVSFTSGSGTDSRFTPAAMFNYTDLD
ncbi:IPT/TIG domain-containing protein [Actinoplanes sp. CA-015351]|uniref:IPT/TIG domain-containing protein n=1 Tax=Actinoplanes sp. CA-015351 TaxID=3239897 RepID=UPI003D98D640